MKTEFNRSNNDNIANTAGIVVTAVRMPAARLETVFVTPLCSSRAA